jgi:hypothetical protein
MKLLALLAAVLCASVLAASAHADAPPKLFDGAGVFVDNPGNLPGPWGLAASLEANHFTWIAFHVNNGLVQYDIPLDWLDVFRAHGIAVGGWGYEDGKPTIEAVLADLAVRRYGLDFFIADAESQYEQAKKLHGWKRSEVFVDTFRSLEPTLPAALTTYGAATAPFVLPIDYESWRNAGFDLLPQAYYNQFPKAYRPDLTVAHSLRAGWPLDRVHPVLGVYRKYAAANYVPLLAGLGTRGFSVFLADQATAADYAALAPLAAAASGVGSADG